MSMEKLSAYTLDQRQSVADRDKCIDNLLSDTQCKSAWNRLSE